MYGDEHTVVKKDCINHVSKGVGTALQKIKKEQVRDDIKFGGARKRTEQRIKDWQRYYYFATKNNAGNVEAMQQAGYGKPIEVPKTNVALHKELGIRLLFTFKRLSGTALLVL